MPAKLYSLELSHPSHAARLMLERKGIEHEVIDLLGGMHPAQLRLRGFRGGTVPALRIDGRRIQGSRQISRVLEELQPEPRLFPPEPAPRRAVEAAEEWGERELQPIPRRLFRWTLIRNRGFRRQMVRLAGMPLPGLMSRGMIPVIHGLARAANADDATVEADLRDLPATLDRVDSLIAEGVIGGEQPNAADLQIGTTVRVLLAFEDLRERIEPRPAAELARRTLPRYPGPLRLDLPAELLPER